MVGRGWRPPTTCCASTIRSSAEGVVRDLRLHAGDDDPHDVGTVDLVRGCLVQGTCTGFGERMRITLCAVDAAGNVAVGPVRGIEDATTATAVDGTYRVSRLLPPGSWRIQLTSLAAEEAVFGSCRAYPGRIVTIAPGQRHSLQNFVLHER